MILATVRRNNTLNGKLLQSLVRVGGKVELGLKAVGQHLLESSRKLVPKDTLALLNSSDARQEGSNFSTVIVVGYGRYGDSVTEISPKTGQTVTRVPSTYAVYVHENPDSRAINPQSHTPPEQSMFLYTPLMTELDQMRMIFRTYV